MTTNESNDNNEDEKEFHHCPRCCQPLYEKVERCDFCGYLFWRKYLGL